MRMRVRMKVWLYVRWLLEVVEMKMVVVMMMVMLVVVRN